MIRILLRQAYLCVAGLFLATQFIATSVSVAQNISGAGATFPYPLYAKWANLYYKATKRKVNYQPIGSGAGLKQIGADMVTFGASDKPLSEEALVAAHLIQWPVVLGAIIVIAYLPNLKDHMLVLNGEVLAEIFLGEIRQWDHPKIQHLNPGVPMPSLPIVTVHRSDGAGTTFNFTHYLARVSKAWQDRIGVSTSVAWPSGVGAKGNEGIAHQVGQTEGAIGYVESMYGEDPSVVRVYIANDRGHIAAPVPQAFQEAALNIHWEAHPSGFTAVFPTQETGSWPILAASYVFMKKSASASPAQEIALQFFDWAYHNREETMKQLNYIPLSSSLIAEIQDLWRREFHFKAQPLPPEG